jgi:hypothetical protein
VTGGIQKSALIGYLVLCIYLISKPSPAALVERAEALDKQLQGQSLSRLSPALAEALEMPVASVDCFLNVPEARPSSLVFNKLLVRCGSHSGEENPAAVILESGIPMRDAVEYFDTIEKQVSAGLTKMATASKPTISPLANNGRQAFGALSVRSQPD